MHVSSSFDIGHRAAGGAAKSLIERGRMDLSIQQCYFKRKSVPTKAVQRWEEWQRRGDVSTSSSRSEVRS
jgi:hypothetical protein